MHRDPEAPHGRGAARNPPNRFTPLWYVRDPDWTDPEDPAPATHFSQRHGALDSHVQREP